MTYQSLNPATGVVLDYFAELSDLELGLKIETAATCNETRHPTNFDGRELGDIGIQTFVNRKLVRTAALDTPV